eukprot:1053863_1
MLHVRSPRLKGKRCIVTGAARGIGAVTATLFAQHGSGLILLDIAPMNNTVEAIKKVAPMCDIAHFQCDISSEENIKNIFEIIETKYGTKSVDILVNNAAILSCTTSVNILSETAVEWNKVLNTNVIGYAIMIKYCVPLMKYDATSSIVIWVPSAHFVLLDPTEPYITSQKPLSSN